MLRVLLVVPLLVASCVPVAFRPARTVPSGETETTLGAMAFNPKTSDLGGPVCFDECRQERRPRTIVPGASLSVRHGVIDGLDVGLGAATLAAVSLDATIGLLRTPVVDVSVGPGFTANFAGDFFPSFVAPLLVDVNLGSAASIVGYASPVVAIGWNRHDDGRRAVGFYQAGAGLDLRATSWLSLRPYFGVLGPLNPSDGDADAIPFYGLGVALGGQRRF